MKIPEGWELVPVEPTSNMRVAYYDCVPPRHFDVASQKWKAMLAAAPTPPAQDEPVLYAISGPDGLVMGDRCVSEIAGDLLDDVYYLNAEEELYREVPLYARPQSNKLREAAEEFIRAHDSDTEYCLGVAVKNLRAALEGE